jgi:alpha-tubulin suppressor-like RCC1 family protein
MATLNFPDNPSTGDTYTDSNAGFTYEWNGTVWISKDPSTASNIREIDDISGSFNGSTTAFTLQVASVNVEPANVQQLIISVGGVMQNAGDDYTVSGSTITFTTAPSSGLTFFGTLLGTALSLNTVADGSVSPSSLTTTSTYIVGGLTADQNAGIVTSYGLVAGVGGVNVSGVGIVTAYGLVAGAGGVNVSGAVTGGSFSGDGSGLTGVASTDNIITSYGATFLSNVRVAGVLTAANAYVTGILTAQTLNYNNVVDIYSTGIITATRGIQQTGNEGLHVSSGITTVGIFTATSARVGLAVTINNTGIDAGIGAGIITAKTYYGDATNMTGAGSTFQALAFDPFKGKRLIQAQLSDNIAMTFNHGIEAGNAAKEVTLRKDSPSGEIVQSFGVGSSITYSAGQAIINPTDAFINENEYFVVIPEGAFKKIGTASSTPLINGYSFLTANFVRKTFSVGRNDYGQLMLNLNPDSDPAVNQRSSPVQVGSTPTFDYATINKQYGYKAIILARDLDTGGNTAWSVGYLQDGQSATNVEDVKYSSPTQIGTDKTWRSACWGDRHIIANKTDGTLWGWGYGDNGSLGLNQPGPRYSSPAQIGSDTTWTDQIGAYSNASFGIKTNGTLWSWGNQMGMGLLGHNEENGGYSSPKQVGTDTTWSKMCKGNSQGDNAYAIKTDGTLWTWGWQYNNGSMGLNNGGIQRISSPTQVGTSTNWHGISVTNQDNDACTMGLKTDGTLWGWGDGNEGKLGLGNENDVSSPTQIGTDTTWGNGLYSGLTNGGDYTFTVGGMSAGAIKTDGTLWTWGKNDFGSLGHNSRSKFTSPKQVGSSTSWGGLAMGGRLSDEGVSYFFEKAPS